MAFLVTLLLSFPAALFAQHDMPAGMTHEQHQAQMKKEAEMNQRGNLAMGFDQARTTHHFLITPDGGTIQVETNDASDTASRDHIRSHLKTIAGQFAQGDFSAPFATHNETIPGVDVMQKLKSKLTYTFEERPRGAAVHIKSSDEKAVAAVHDFLNYQIKEHRTGDPAK